LQSHQVAEFALCTYLPPVDLRAVCFVRAILKDIDGTEDILDKKLLSKI
jgi:hypothetical protein